VIAIHAKDLKSRREVVLPEPGNEAAATSLSAMSTPTSANVLKGEEGEDVFTTASACRFRGGAVPAERIEPAHPCCCIDARSIGGSPFSVFDATANLAGSGNITLTSFRSREI
jgi:hypothetical protein